jgi:hypothetical protein
MFFFGTIQSCIQSIVNLCSYGTDRSLKVASMRVDPCFAFGNFVFCDMHMLCCGSKHHPGCCRPSHACIEQAGGYLFIHKATSLDMVYHVCSPKFQVVAPAILDANLTAHTSVGGARTKYEEALSLDPLHVDTYNAWALLCKSKRGTTATGLPDYCLLMSKIMDISSILFCGIHANSLHLYACDGRVVMLCGNMHCQACFSNHQYVCSGHIYAKLWMFDMCRLEVCV